MGRTGLVVSVLVTVGAVALAPVFSRAVNGVNFSGVMYGSELQAVLGQLPLIVALFGIVFIGSEITR